MKNSLKALILVSAFLQGAPAMGLEVKVSVWAVAEDHTSLEKISAPYEPRMMCNGREMSLTEACTLEANQTLVVEPGYPRSADNCTFTFTNNTLLKGDCLNTWNPVIFGGQGEAAYIALQYCNDHKCSVS